MGLVRILGRAVSTSGQCFVPAYWTFSTHCTHCLQFERCREWVDTLSSVDAEMVGVTEQESGRSVEPNMTEAGVCVANLERMAVKNGKIKKNTRVSKKKFLKPTRRMVE